MTYKRNIIIILFLLISSYSFSSHAMPDGHDQKCIQEQETKNVSETFKERVIIIDREIRQN